MFREMRRFKQQLGEEETKALLRSNRRAAFSVHGEDGYPYTVPINFYYEEAENKIYLHVAKEGHKLDAIRANDKICLTTWDDGYVPKGEWAYYVSSCVVFGRAKPVESRAITEEKVWKLAMKYFPSKEDAEEEYAGSINRVQLVELQIDHMTGKRVHEK